MGLGEVRHTTDMDWGWMDVERLLVATFYTGLLVCFPMCYCVLLATNGNVIISTTSLVTIHYLERSLILIYKELLRSTVQLQATKNIDSNGVFH